MGKEATGMETEKTYIAIDLKSFYASVECVERNLDPLTTNLVVADLSRTEKTICLAVSPALKRFGIPGRPRLFEVVERVRTVNAERLKRAPGHRFTGRSTDANALDADPSLELDYIVAMPRMAYYMEYSTRIVDIYLRYASISDMHVYSVDEVFIDVTTYLRTNHIDAQSLAMQIIHSVLRETGITATAGIGTNLYLAKIAMDIVAKRMKADEHGVRIAYLDEMRYRETLWSHRPLTDFWRIGHGYVRKLESNHLYTMGDVARCSLENEALLYRLFGVNAELLIDHAWGWEPCEMKHIKSYRPESNSLSVGQVLSGPYAFDAGEIIVREMAGGLALDLVGKHLVTNQIVLTVGYDTASVPGYTGATEMDRYGRPVPKPTHGSENLAGYTASSDAIIEAAVRLYRRIVDRNLFVRRMYVVASRVLREEDLPVDRAPEQLNLLTDYAAEEQAQHEADSQKERERKLQETMLAIKSKHGKNAILTGTSYREGATGRERNEQIGGHKA